MAIRVRRRAVFRLPQSAILFSSARRIAFAAKNKNENPLDSLHPLAAAFFARHPALIALALFAIVGAFVFDDYVITSDEGLQRKIGYASFNYIFGDEDALLDEYEHDRFYCIAFAIPLLAISPAVGGYRPRRNRESHWETPAATGERPRACPFYP